IFELLAVSLEILIELGLGDSGLLRRVGDVPVSLGGSLKVGRRHVRQRLIHLLELAANGIPLSVSVCAEESVNLGTELPHRTTVADGLLAHDLHGRGETIDVSGRASEPAGAVSPGAQRSFPTLRGKEVVEPRPGRG